MDKVTIRPFDPADLIGFQVQPEQANEWDGDAGTGVRLIQSQLPAPVSVVAPTGKVLVVGGVTPGHHGGALALVAADAGPWMTGVVRALRGWFAEQEAWRISLVVRCDFRAGHRFAALLGFEAEGRMRAFGPNREDYMLYAMVRA